LVLDDMEVGASGFLIAVGIFTITTALMQPFIAKVAMKNATALMGATALVATFVGLLVTVLVTNDDALRISGASTWLMGTVIVWLAAMIAGLLIPFILAKRGVEAVREKNSR
jgi:Co/Zn/Cd efflux system component